MDIYQIWITYNKPWSEREIYFWCVILAVTAVAMAFCVYKKKITIVQALLVCVLTAFLGIVFASTIFTRTTTVRQYELMPFWS